MKHAARSPRAPLQFSLAALFEFATLCAILSALFRASGMVASVFLMGMALALGARQGLVAVAMFMAASLAADISASPDGPSSLARQGTVIFIASMLCGWYLLRSRLLNKPALPHAAGESSEIAKPPTSAEKTDG